MPPRVHGCVREDLQGLSSSSAAKLTLEAKEETDILHIARVRLELIHKSYTHSDKLKPATKPEPTSYLLLESRLHPECSRCSCISSLKFLEILRELNFICHKQTTPTRMLLLPFPVLS